MEKRRASSSCESLVVAGMDTKLSELEARIKAAESDYEAAFTAGPSSEAAEKKEFLREKLSRLVEERKYLWEERKYLRAKEEEERKYLRTKEEEERKYLRTYLRAKEEEEREERKYLRAKEEEERKHLRELEERKHLREEEERKHLREKELLKLKSKIDPSGPNLSTLEDICGRYWDKIVLQLPQMPTKESFKKDFSRCKKQICVLGEKPTLLLQGLLEKEYFPSSHTLLQEFLNSDAGVCFLVDASGSGKTRTLYELATRVYCVFLTGVSEAGFRDEGSRDLWEVSAWLKYLYCDEAEGIPQGALDCCMQALLIARLYILMRAMKYDQQFTPLTWLVKQVFFRLLNYPDADPWATLTKELLALVTRDNIEEAHDVFTKFLCRLSNDVNWKGLIIIDECQEVGKYLSNRFLSGESKLNRSMLDKLYMSLQNTGMGKQKIVISGTGRNLLRLLNDLTGSVKNTLGHITKSNFGGFMKYSDIEQYTLNLIEDATDFDFKQIFQVYKGRYRLFVTALEKFIIASAANQDLKATDFLREFAYSLCTMTGAELSISRSLHDDVITFFAKPTYHPEAWQLVIDMVLLHFFTGKHEVCVVDRDLGFVQAGLGRVCRYPEQVLPYRRDAIFFPQANNQVINEVRLTNVQLFEPMIMMTLWLHLRNNGELMRNQIAQLTGCSDSEFGLRYEVYSAESLGNLFDGRIPSSFVSKKFRDEVRPIYHERIRLVKPKLQGYCLIKTMNNEGDFLQWLEDFESALRGDVPDTFCSFLHSGPIQKFGPDLIWGYISESNKPVIAIGQHKVKNEIWLKGAIDSLDVDQFYLHAPHTDQRSTAQEACVSKFKGLCKLGGLMKLVVTTTLDINETRRGNVYQEVYGNKQKKSRSYDTLHADELVGIIDKNVQFLAQDRWFTEAVNQLKRRDDDGDNSGSDKKVRIL